MFQIIGGNQRYSALLVYGQISSVPSEESTLSSCSLQTISFLLTQHSILKYTANALN